MTQVLDVSPTFNYSLENGPATRLGSFNGLAYHRVVLVSSHPLFLVGLRTELSHYPDFKVVGEVSSATEVLELVNGGPVGLIVIDQVKPGEALTLIRTLQYKLNRRVPMVVLGSSENESQINALHELGVNSFAPKTLDGPALGEVMQKAVRGRRPLPGIRPSLSEGAWPVRTVAVAPVKITVKLPLSPREIQILQVIAQGYSNKEVAQVLCISNHTLKNHLNNIFKKLEVEDRTQALMLSVRNGWVKL